MNDVKPTTGSRHVAIARFLMKYRKAGVFKRAELNGGVLAESAGVVEESTATPEQFVDDLEALGPTFIKIGQSLSTRPDLVPAEYIAALERMQDDVAPVDFHVVRETVESELGVRLTKAFESFEEKPLAAASLAQVHGAVTRSGRQVAVKVQRPDVVEQLRADIDILRRVAGAADKVTPMGRAYHFTDWVGEFQKTLSEELDYRLEAANLERFARNLSGWSRLYVPRPLLDMTATRVLTMERVQGHKVTQGIELLRMERPLDDLARELLKAYLDQMFVHGLIHADPHPGNVMMTDDGRLALIDLGMVAHVPPKLRDRLFQLLLAVIDARGENVAEVCMSIGTRLEDFDEAEFVRSTGRLIAQYDAQDTLDDRPEGVLLQEVTQIGVACGLRPPREMPLLAKTLMNVENVSRTLAPNLDVKEAVREHMHEVLTKQMLRSMSPSRLGSELIEMHELVRDLPRRAHSLLRNLADNRFRVQLGGLEETQLVENLQKIANRITAGLITASLIIGAALMMRVETAATLWGYPAIALVMFLLAAMFGIALVVQALRRDRKAPSRDETTPI